MGWTYIHAVSRGSVKDLIANRLSGSGEHYTYRTLDIAIVNFTEAYAAVERTHNDTGHTVVLAMVALLDIGSRQFGYKDMSEDMEPYYYNCPKRILDRLSPADQIYEAGSTRLASATAWRDKCLATIDRRRRVTRPGAKVRSERPIKFSDGVSRQDFTSVGRGTYVSRDGAFVRFKRHQLEVLSPV